MSNITDKLRLIMEGNLLLEAEEDKYDVDIPGDSKDDKPDTKDGGDAAPSTADSGTADATGDNTGSGDDNNDDTTDADADADSGGGYDLDDAGDDGDETDGPATSDDADGTTDSGDGSTDDSSTSPETLPGETLTIDPKTRAILAFKNFEQYRDLRDDSIRLISELSEFIPVNDSIRDIVSTAIEKGTDLVNKLNDYIQYKYSDTSYELNYYNFMQFLLEKRYVGELYDAIIKTSSQAKGNK